MSIVLPVGGPVERRLTAILSADVVGYSRLMGEDEAGTLKALKTHQSELIDPKAAQYGGRIIKLMGDGVLMEFGSVVDAVHFAVEMQCAMHDRNAGLPEQRQILYRIGINIGDVIVEGDDIYGDGVNVAARLEGLAEPGGICVARNAYDQVRDKLDLNFSDLGDIEVKNISRPIRAFRVATDEKASALRTPIVQPAQRPTRNWSMVAGGIAGLVLLVLGAVVWSYRYHQAAEAPSTASLAHQQGDKPSIAVLPFLAMSGEANQQHFADGISDDLTTQLSKVAGLFVISRTTASKYRDHSVDVRNVAKDLGVRYVLEGSVRRGGETFRINAQLIDATTGGHIWAEIFDGQAADAFALQDEINSEIVRALRVKLTPEEEERVLSRGTDNQDAYDAFLTAERYRTHSKQVKFLDAIPYYEKAIGFDRNFGAAYAGLGHVLWRRFKYGRGFGFREDLLRAQEMADRAFALGERVLVHMLRAKMYLFDKYDHKNAEQQARKAIKVSPNNAEALVTLATVLLYAGKPEAATQLVEKAMTLNPAFPYSYQILMAQAKFEGKQYREAIDRLSYVCNDTTSFLYLRLCRIYAASAHGHLGEVEAGLKQTVYVSGYNVPIEPRLATVEALIRFRFPFKDKSSEEHLLAGIRKIM